MDAKAETWCDRDEHKLFEYYVDFNDWLDSDDAALDVLEGLGDLESKGIIEEVPLLPHLDIRRRETLHRRTHV